MTALALLGTSSSIEAIRRHVAQLAARQRGARRVPPILILGETGTGKGLLARTLHQAGPRRGGPFIDINCAAIPETLLEAELFGYERGAFTDARHAKPGLLQTAHGGTLLLDEIGLLPAAMQSKLLTVLEDRAVRRLGGTRAEPVDVAVVAATSVDLRRAVSDGRFRQDLYHRLAVITLELPPLRTRGRDVLALAEHFLTRACADYGLSPRALTPEAREVLLAHRWPGNVRELANAMERVAVFSDRGEITGAMLDFLTSNDAEGPDAAAATGSLEDAVRASIEAALGASAGKIRRTAAALGISRNTLRARMDKYGLRRHGAALPDSVREPVSPGATSVSPQWARRHLSFLRVRLLASSTDVTRVLETVGDKVRAFGGRIEEPSPTGFIAVFGIEPVDNAPSHAALAALAIQHAAARARAVGGRGVDVVMAIHAAEHLVNHRESPPVIGVDGKAATWSILEALVADEGAGAIVLSGPVVPFLARRFTLEPEQDGERNAWRLLSLEEMSAGWRATRFVGRTSELSALRHAAALAEQGHGQIVSVVGEAGVGKSRLVHEVVQRLQGWRVLSSGGAPYSKDTPYYPIVELLQGLCHIPQHTDAAAEVWERVASALPADVDVPSVLPPILDLLAVLPPNDPFHDVEPAQRRRRTHDAVRQVLLAASRIQPLCLLIDDLQWIDCETQEVLDGLVNSMTGARVLLLVNYRPEYRQPWGGKSYYSQVRLDALSTESAGELLDVLLGHDPGLAPLKQLLVTQGNPCFLEETVRMLVDAKALAGARGRYRPVHPVASIQIPPTVQAMLAARIDRLPPEDRDLLQVASVVGKDASFMLLQAVTDLGAEALRRGIDRLQAAEFIYEAQLFPDLEYTFTHALTREVAYAGILEERCRALHARILETLERFHAGRLGEHAEVLAHHAERAANPEKAVGYLREAGTKAAARSANREAIDFFERALALLAALPQTREIVSATLDVRIALGAPLIAMQGPASPAVEASYRAALEVADRLDAGPRRFPALWGLWYVRFARGDYAAAVEAGERLLDIAEQGEDGGQRLEAHHTLWPTLVSMGEVKRAMPHLERGIALYSRERHASIGSLYGGHDPGACCHCFLAMSQWALGYPDRARASARDAVRLAEALGHAVTSTMTLGYVTSLLYLLGDRPAVIACAEQCLAIIEAHGFRFRAQPVRVLLYAARGDRPDVAAIDALQRERTVESMPTWHMLSGCALAWLYGEAGAPEQGLAMLAAMGNAERYGLYGPEIHRVEGELRRQLAANEPDDAVRCFQRALDLARRRELKSLELRAATSLARLWRDHGRRDDALRPLADVYSWFTEGFDTQDLRAARALLDERGPATSRPASAPAQR